MKHLFLITAYLMVLGCFGQQILFVYAKKVPVPNAHVTFFAKGENIEGAITTNNGHFRLPLANNIDSLKIQHLSYLTKIFTWSSLKNLDTLFIDEANEVLGEVELKYTVEQTWVGPQKKFFNTAINGAPSQQIVTLIASNRAHPVQIQSISFQQVNYWSSDSTYFKLLFYENNNGLPGKEFHRAIVCFINKETKKKVKVNTRNLNVFLPPEGLFIGIEWMGCEHGWHEAKNNIVKPPCNLAVVANKYKLTGTFPLTYFRFPAQDSTWRTNCIFSDDKVRVPLFRVQIF
jgi:hypothetical protein